MHVPADLTAIAITAVVALICGMGMDRLQQPAIVGYILAGVVLGPTGFGLVKSQEGVLLLAELGVLMLLFLVGMHLSLRAFKEVWKVSLGVAVCQSAAGVLIMLLASWIFGFSAEMAVVLGFVVALSSTAVVIKLLEQLNILRQPAGQVTIGILIAQDLAVVPMLLSIDAIGAGGIEPLQVLKIIAAVALLVTFIYALSRRRRVVLPFTHWIRDHQDLVPLAGLVYCFGAATLTGLAGLSPVLGAFLAGLLIGNSTSRPVMIQETRPVQAVLMMVFFLSIGLLIDLGFIWDNLGVVLLLLLLVSVLKTAFNIGIIRLMGEPWTHAFIAGIILAQIGEFSLVISQAASAAKIIGADETQLIIAVTALSLLITPLWLAMGRRVMRAVILSVTSYDGLMDAIRGVPVINGALRAARRTRMLAADAASRLPTRLSSRKPAAPPEAAAGDGATPAPAAATASANANATASGAAKAVRERKKAKNKATGGGPAISGTAQKTGPGALGRAGRWLGRLWPRGLWPRRAKPAAEPIRQLPPPKRPEPAANPPAGPAADSDASGKGPDGA